MLGMPSMFMALCFGKPKVVMSMLKLEIVLTLWVLRNNNIIVGW